MGLLAEVFGKDAEKQICCPGKLSRDLREPGGIMLLVKKKLGMKLYSNEKGGVVRGLSHLVLLSCLVTGCINYGFYYGSLENFRPLAYNYNRACVESEERKKIY